MGDCAEGEETAGYGTGWKEEIGWRLGKKRSVKSLDGVGGILILA